MNHQADRFTVFVDACVLASALKRNLILSLAETAFFRLRWSDKVLDETERTIAKLLERLGAVNPLDGARRQIANMRRAFEDAEVQGYERLELALPEN